VTLKKVTEDHSNW